MPSCTNCGAWTPRKDSLCSDCLVLRNAGMPLGEKYDPAPSTPDSNPPEQDPFDMTDDPIPQPEQNHRSSPFRKAAPAGGFSAQSSLEESPGVYSGTVVNIKKFAPKKTRKGKVSLMSRWSNSFLRGVPFSMKPLTCTFQLQRSTDARFQSQGVGEAVSVHVFMDDNDYVADFVPGSLLRVHGHPGPHNYIYANSIENLSTGTRMGGMGGISCWVIRAISVLLPLMLFVLYSGSFSGFSLPFDFSGLPSRAAITDACKNIATLAIVAVILLMVLRRNANIRKYAIWIGVTIALGLIDPSLAAIVITIGGFLLLMKFFR